MGGRQILAKEQKSDKVHLGYASPGKPQFNPRASYKRHLPSPYSIA